MKPILFNTEMVRAILDGRKTVTRRTVSQGKSNPLYHNREKFYRVVDHLNDDYKNWYAGFYNDNDIFYGTTGGRHIDAIYFKAPYKVNDILYVRETWCGLPVTANGHMRGHDVYYYKADGDHRPVGWRGNWRPSIHMPKEAARIFLKVTGVRVERLQDMRLEDFKNEGTIATSISPEDDLNYRFEFINLWDTTIKKDQLQYYGWDANPYVWVIEFEVIDKAALQKLQGTVGVTMVNKLVKEGKA